jgi:nicotinamidase/pyrazinamidase
MKKKILFIIDAQEDFLEGGSLAVEGARQKMNALADYLVLHGKKYDGIYLTADWHLPTHCSFKENGGIWPPHCIQYSKGAAIHQSILSALHGEKLDYFVLTKGCNEDHEEYSVFKNAESRAYLENINSHMEIDTVDFCGIAYDYCLKDSALDSKKVFTNSTIRVLKDFCPCIGDPNETTKILEDNNIVIV